VSAFRGKNVAEGRLGRFLEEVKAGRIEQGSVLIIESLDRLSRQEPRKALEVFLAIINAGITIATLADDHEYEPNKTDMLKLLGSILKMGQANEESAKKSYRSTANWAAKRANATSRPMTAACPAWLRLSRDRSKYEVITERVTVVRRIFRDAADGMGFYTITRRLNEDRAATAPSPRRARGSRRTCTTIAPTGGSSTS
jgi:DNA invertase Pin-like site-specific DNA recombinase